MTKRGYSCRLETKQAYPSAHWSIMGGGFPTKYLP